MAKETQRLFLAIPLPQELKEKLTRQQEYLREKLPALKVSWLKQEQMHLTLIFLGETPRRQTKDIIVKLQNGINGGAFELSVGALGVFPNFNKPRVIWLGLTGGVEQLQDLHQKGVAALSEFDFQRRKLKPHLTLGRIRRGFEPNINQTFANAEKIDYRWLVESLRLYKSELRPDGAVHEVLASFELS